MKNIFKISIALALVFGTVSCNMDLRPYSVIDPNNALETYADAEKLANGFNNHVRSLAVGSKYSMVEIQSDFFNATLAYGNRGGEVYRWEFEVGSRDAESLWSSCYTVIANANFFIQKVAYVKERVKTDSEFAKTWSEEELYLLDGHLGEALFLRAYAHYLLVDRFSASYTEENADVADSGIPVVTSYAPTSDKSKYPGRNTLAETFEQIMEDLGEAVELIPNLRDNAAGSNYITEDAAKALRARAALACGDYAQAIQDATSIINSGNYALVNGVENLKKLFVDDNVPSEVILQSYVTYQGQELPNTNDYGYVGYSYANGTYSPDYLPAQWVVDLYDEKDYRKQVFFLETPCVYNKAEVGPLYVFSKFIGNRALEAGASSWSYINAPKPFRLAELYLIAAEAYAASPATVSNASDILNEFQSYRYDSWTAKVYNANDIVEAIRDERVRELIGEGFRLSDLKRYNNGMTRKPAQLSSILALNGMGSDLSVPAGNFRFVWPIPKTETDTNPKIKQNDGYNTK